MSGHSHSHNVARLKESVDAKRGKIFTKVARAITIAAKKGGSGDPSSNSFLRITIEKAREVNMPKDNIERAIKRAVDASGEGELYELRYEGYGPEGVAIMIDIATDNKNRTLAEIRQILNRHGGSLGEPGCAAYVFGQDPENPQFRIPVDEKKKERILDMIAELEDNDDVQEVFHNLEVLS
ncbi:YebC/PmpR family DNA-binding transcriptional regulator [candidate division WWE3 bacterium CG08_land_8_20_14_0_20_40_13]|uniref:YebC/PmpR family DNA-binding transcriptional regulator n=1 Tax=candidate division WWE3 bacterium CG08_land_8_20_14_0_20_40_13 TaxID=1975084 RepID=A0A2H0XE90_UNCKA|nr:MAG: YebC/PmpR family DNA-binding transcriptional regulator [candidate division WWE3 bacterium CG08_land_8_20_14_0_20_40_13]